MRDGASARKLKEAARGRWHLPAVAAATLSALALTACGGGGDSNQPTDEQAADAKAIVSLGTQLKRAYDQNDAAAACALLDPQGLKQQFTTKRACEKQVSAAISQGSNRPEIDFDEVTVNGDTASAVTRSDDGENTYDFVRVDGKWYIDIGNADSDSSAQ